MNILILNTNNPLREAGIVAFDLFNNLMGNGHNVRLLVKNYSPNYPEGIISMRNANCLFEHEILKKIIWRINWIKELLFRPQKSDPNYCFFTLKEQKRYYRTKKLLRKAGMKPDAIIILYAQKFINLKNIYQLNKMTHAPIFWLMYDMAPFTGGCHYAWDCKGYQNRCGSCPGLFSSDPDDVSYKNFSNKKFFIDKIDINLISASEWQFQQAKESFLYKNKQIYKILLSVDPSVFRPGNKEKLRREMHIPISKKIIYFGAVGLKERRKGMDYLIESLKYLKERISVDDSKIENDIFLLVAGKSFDVIADSLPFEYRYLGYLDNIDKIASAYQVADVFICPSIEDSGPTMINQSIMTGTPVVSFEMGVSIDLVITGKTGFRAKLRDSIDMAHGLYEILTLNKADYQKLSINCRKLALELCSPKVRMELLEDLFKKADLQ